MTEERKITEIPQWAQRLAELIYLGEDMGVGQLETWENDVRPIVLDPELSKKYEANYDTFSDAHCGGCFEGHFNDENASTDHVCPLFASYPQWDYKMVIMAILEGKKTECGYQRKHSRERQHDN